MKITFYLFIYFFEMRKTTTKKEKDFSDCVVRHERGTKKLDGGGDRFTSRTNRFGQIKTETDR